MINKIDKIIHCLKNIGRFIAKYHYEIVAIVALMSLFGNIMMAAWGIKVNGNSVDLTFRPYLSIDIENPTRGVNGNDTFYGGNIIVRNKGKVPASNVDARLYVTTDMDKTNREGLDWFEKNLGGRSAISFVIPDAIMAAPGFRSLSPSAEYYYFEAIISYEGLKKNRIYWTHIRKVFYVDKRNNSLYPVFVLGKWDQNIDFVSPKLLMEKEVVELIDSFKNKREAMPPLQDRVVMGEKI